MSRSIAQQNPPAKYHDAPPVDPLRLISVLPKLKSGRCAILRFPDAELPFYRSRFADTPHGCFTEIETHELGI